VARWVAATPDGFKFCPKLPKGVTHQGLLKPAIAAALEFVELMNGLNSGVDGRLGAILAQLPPSYGPDRLADLVAFLEAWPFHGVPLAVEVRHPAWFQVPYAEQLNTLLRSHQASRVLLDSRPIYHFDDDPQIHSERRKPQLPLQIATTAQFAVVRFISHPRLENNAPFLETWVEQVRAWLATGVSVYFFVHCPLEERSPDIARHFQHVLQDAGVPVPRLPWDEVNNLRSLDNTENPQVDEQLSLF
jgi:uncharacterized protein YecE (DUF72 family)